MISLEKDVKSLKNKFSIRIDLLFYRF